jgi:hypothetical protein
LQGSVHLTTRGSERNPCTRVDQPLHLIYALARLTDMLFDRATILAQKRASGWVRESQFGH